MSIDLNVDLGEGMPADHDRSLMALATSASIACGGHAGDATTMRRTVVAALETGVRIGAHPSYPDRDGFGRVPVPLAPLDIWRICLDQVTALADVAGELGAEIEYIKPHGALYTDAVQDPVIADAVVEVGRAYSLLVMALRSSEIARRYPELVIVEGFADRRYVKGGALAPRSDPDALITSPDAAANQALHLAPHVQTICVHSDTPGAPEILSSVREALTENGYQVAAR